MNNNILGQLQSKVIKLEKQVVKQHDLLIERKEKYSLLQKKYNYLENNNQKDIEKAVSSATIELKEENEKLKQEIEKLKYLLNQNNSNFGIPTSKTSIGNIKYIPNSREKSDKKIGGQIGHKSIN